MTIKLSNYLNGTRDYAKGYEVFQDIRPSLIAGNQVTIDFDGVVGVGSSLLHGLMGEAFTLIGIQETKRLIKVTNIMNGDLQYLKQYAQDMESIINKAPTKA